MNEVYTNVKTYNCTSSQANQDLPHLATVDVSAPPISTAWVGRTPVLRSLIPPIPYGNIENRGNVADGNTAEETRSPDPRLKRVLGILVLTGVQTVVWHHITVGILVDLVAHECAVPCISECS